MRRRAWLALLAAACWSAALPASADESGAEAGDGSPPDPLRVGFSPLVARDLAAGHRYLADALPRLLRERLAEIDRVETVAADAPVGVLPRRIAAAADLDLLVWGRIETVSDHLMLEWYAFDAAQARRVWSYYESGEADVLPAAVEPAADRLAPLLLGQPWSRLAVDPVPEDSAVRLDGALIGIGATLLRYTAPRRAELTVTRPGYQDEVLQVELAPGRELRVAVELVRRDLGTVLVDSRPGGAAVYAASEYVGDTPVRLPRPPADTPLALVLDGYADATARLGPGTPATLTVALQPAGFDAAAAQAGGRDRFYEELGWFAMSLLPPLVLSALVADSAARDVAQQQTAEPSWQPATIGFTIGTVAAVGYSVYRLVRTIGVMIDYTETAERPAG